MTNPSHENRYDTLILVITSSIACELENFKGLEILIQLDDKAEIIMTNPSREYWYDTLFLVIMSSIACNSLENLRL